MLIYLCVQVLIEVHKYKINSSLLVNGINVETSSHFTVSIASSSSSLPLFIHTHLHNI